MKDNSGLCRNSNGVGRVEADTKIEPEPQPSGVVLKDCSIGEKKQKDANFYMDLYCNILKLEHVDRREAEHLFMVNVASLQRMRMVNPDKLVWLMYGEYMNDRSKTVSDEDIFIHILERLKKEQICGHAFRAVMAYSM